jgi:acetyl-CoA C-acetyltransferase
MKWVATHLLNPIRFDLPAFAAGCDNWRNIPTGVRAFQSSVEFPMSDVSVVIVGSKRTAIGSFLGQFTGVPTPKLGATAIRAALEQSAVAPADVSEVIMGCVLPANLGQAPARQAALGADLPTSVGCTTINKVCGSGMKAIMLGHDLIKAGSATVVVAGGMESMTNAPHMVNARTGIRYGDGQLVDHMAWDGLTNPYDGKSMGVFGEMCADKYHFTREDQDAFAIESVNRAKAAQQNGAFADEIVPVTVSGRKGDVQVDTDEQPGRSDVAKVPTLRPAFRKENGTITAATSSSISDGAAAVVLLSADDANKRGLKPLARIVAHATHSQEPEWFTTAPVGAIQKVLDKAGWKVEEVDLFEINEAFAVVAMTPMKELGIPHDKLNVNGGACALGHPIGASGARLVVTLLNARRGGFVHRWRRGHGDRAGMPRLISNAPLMIIP